MKSSVLFIALALGTFAAGLAVVSASRSSPAAAPASPAPVAGAQGSDSGPITPFSGSQSWGMMSAPSSGGCGSGCACR